MGEYGTFAKRRALERGAAADVWRNTLSQVPSVFGRLVYLSSLIDANSGKYRHHGLANYFSEDEADAALRQSHDDGFAQWLSLPLARQRQDLELYLADLEGDRKSVLSAWLRLERYRECMPAGARDVEKDLFLIDLESLLALFRNEYGVSLPDPNA